MSVDVLVYLSWLLVNTVDEGRLVLATVCFPVDVRPEDILRYIWNNGQERIVLHYQKVPENVRYVLGVQEMLKRAREYERTVLFGKKTIKGIFRINSWFGTQE